MSAPKRLLGTVLILNKSAATKCRIHFLDDDSEVQIDLPTVEGYVIGRADIAREYKPDIDLSGHQSFEKGISRRHAALVNLGGIPHIIDLYSANGTFLNGKRLAPDQPYPLGDSNKVQLGTLNVIITIY